MPAEWPEKVRLQKPPKASRVHIAPHRPAPGFEANWENETRVYVPESSDLVSLAEVRKALEPLFELRAWCRRAGSPPFTDDDGISGEEAYKIVAGASNWDRAIKALDSLATEEES